jgi:hypothetical protein
MHLACVVQNQVEGGLLRLARPRRAVATVFYSISSSSSQLQVLYVFIKVCRAQTKQDDRLPQSKL